ncbi:outer membrane lipoprotein-sorting protein [Amphiplicatus metriothermophilus]|uniref:Outer membrane lipoprotein-sorting protein n=1 Tax=Amphiplicatus metriothermophilus TaxID=1519374 RepID=A0A239PRQ8_9PROT|nr:outer membrane lipoprotein-sorting protein [Amphiplicatus metriothermophilus]MBB5518451.1 outer membrane lipoprotein-sorting protein [Amphiplicatus metriothermophilus]SNT72387.1 outer membrane lipoprotein-sorting protein [Amphiplicatus metriothermophilus]
MSAMRTRLAGALALAVAVVPASAETDISAQAIVNKASAAAYYQGADGKATVSMTIADAQGRKRTREFVILRADVDDLDNGEQRFYVYFSRPADVNRTAFLVWKHVGSDDDRWLYLPALDLVKRIAASDERTSFVGSHFFYEDVSGRSPEEDTHILVEETENYYVIESAPKKPDAVEFSKYKNWIHKSTFIPVKTEYYDQYGEVYRTYSALRVEDVEGHPTVVESRMEDRNIGGVTTMVYRAVDYDIGLPMDIFSERYLRTPPREHLR